MFNRYRWIFRAWKYRLKVERPEVHFVCDSLGPGDVAIDIGAHKGAHTYWMAGRVGTSGKVFAFEPQPILAQRLQQLTCSLPHVKVENAGLSSQEGQLTLHVPCGGVSPGATFEHVSDATPHDRYLVPVTTLDRYCEAAGWPHVRLIKCDTEGHELEVLQGAKHLLASQHPHLLLECEARHRASRSVEEVLEFLATFGYDGSLLTRSGPLHVSQFDASVHQADPDGPHYANNFALSAPQILARAS